MSESLISTTIIYSLKFKLMQKAKRIQSHNTQGGEVYEKPKK